MNTAAVRHLSFYPFVQAVARDKIRFRLDAAAGDLTTCELVWWKRSTPEEKHVEPLTIRISSRSTDQWTCRVVFGEEVHYIKYGYRLTDASGKRVWYNAVGFHGEETEEGSFEILQVNETDVLRIPSWTQGCIYYQIFPDRFARGGNGKGSYDSWDAVPTRENILGGNLRGIIDHLDYLQDLGVSAFI